MSDKLNLEFYGSLLDSAQKAIAGFQATIDHERAEKEEALQMAGELEATNGMKDARIAELETENAQLKSGFEAVEIEGLRAIAQKIEALHNAVSNLSNPAPVVVEAPEVEETEDETEEEEI